MHDVDAGSREGWAVLRRRGDPAADAVIDALVARDEVASANAALARLERNHQPPPRELPPALRSFLEREGVPSWAELDRVARAQAFADRHAVAIATALFCGALPAAYAGAKGAAVLALTRRLLDDVDRRVQETGRFVLDVLTPGGFGPHGRAVRSVQKVRLLHAAVRRLARGPAGEVAINQEDLLGTLTCFSVVVLRSLEGLGVRVSCRESQDYLHLWCVVGAMSGLEPALLPRSVEEAEAIEQNIRARHARASRHGTELTRVLVDGIERHVPMAKVAGLAPRLMRHLLGEPMGDVLGLPRAMPLRRLAGALPRPPALGGRRLLEEVLAGRLGGKPPAFAAPLHVLSRGARGAVRGGVDEMERTL